MNPKKVNKNELGRYIIIHPKVMANTVKVLPNIGHHQGNDNTGTPHHNLRNGQPTPPEVREPAANIVGAIGGEVNPYMQEANPITNESVSPRDNNFRLDVNAAIQVNGSGSMVVMEPVDSTALTTEIVRQLNQSGAFGNTETRRHLHIRVTGGVTVVGDRNIVGADLTGVLHAAHIQQVRGMAPRSVPLAGSSRHVSGQNQREPEENQQQDPNRVSHSRQASGASLGHGFQGAQQQNPGQGSLSMPGSRQVSGPVQSPDGNGTDSQGQGQQQGHAAPATVNDPFAALRRRDN